MWTIYKEQGLTLLLLVLSLAVSESTDDPEHSKDARRTADPLSNFFSELGDLFLDVDKAIAVQSQPKVEHEANIMSQLLKPRPDYFNRIQTNYKDMQKRLGRLIGDTIGFRNTYSDHELSTVSPPSESSSPVIIPDRNPFAEAAETRKEKLKQKLSNGSSRDLNKDLEKLFIEPGRTIPETVDKSLKAFGQFSKEIIDNIGRVAKESSSLKSTGNKFSPKRTGSLSILEECSNEVLEDPDLEKRRQEKCSRIAAEERIRADLRKLMLEPRRATEALFSKNIETFDQLTKDISGRSGDVMGNKILDADVKQSEAELDLESIDECSEALEDTLSSSMVEKCSRKIAEKNLIGDLNKIILSKESSEKLIPVGLKTIDELSSFLIKRSGDAEDRSPEDSLSSVPYDTQIRQLIKDHGSWILDYPLIKLWRERDRTTDSNNPADQNEEDLTTVENFPDVTEIEPTELYMPVSTNYEMAVEKSGESVPDNIHQSSYYTIVNEDGDVLEEDIDFVYQPESLSNDIESFQIERQEQKETIILAFTSDGVPLKLRLGPEIDNPLQYLHKALKSAGVSLNIPVESYDDLEPVGKEVLKLGSGILTRAVLINVSNTNELKSLLKALMSYQSSGKTTL